MTDLEQTCAGSVLSPPPGKAYPDLIPIAGYIATDAAFPERAISAAFISFAGLTTMSIEDIKNFSTIAAAIIVLMSNLILFFLVFKKEKLFEGERQQFSLNLKNIELQHAKKLQDERHDFEKEKQEIVEAQNKLNYQYSRKLQRQRAELDAWKIGYELETTVRNDALRRLRTAVITLFDHFQNMLQLALRADDQEILGVLAKCIQALSNLDHAIDAAKSIVRNDIEAAKLHRLHIIQRFFLRVILDLTRRKTERISQAPALRKMESRLKKRKEVTMHYLQSVMEERPRAPDIGSSE
ncbi:hypothetical protein FHI69_03575 [Janthinobacterium lividum]|uniref:Uncharacterized protein n=1 Tax=Janthinobacterium lividum TaxID=29581 RepID=A0A5C4NVB5_9BURK|nr:hypothetical protein [Janthinobacterium lividum]TNC78383.1 hypothetical protein FHI69_03575 [Janthinobacterium lividum]